MLRAIWPFLMALLTLLKIVGILLLVLLLILLAVLLLILFVPVRYRTDISNEQATGQEGGGLASKLQVQLKVTWLFRFIHISIRYGAGGMQSQIRAAGIDVLETLARFSRRREEKQSRRAGKKGHEKHKEHKERKKHRRRNLPGQQGQKEQNLPGQQGQKEQNLLGQQELEGQNLPGQQNQPKEHDRQREKLSQGGNSSGAGALPGPKEGPDSGNGTGRLHRQSSKASRNFGAASGLKAKFGNLREMLGRCRNEIKEEANRNAALHIWKELCCLLRSYKPRKLKADIAFSLADPALTGNVVGLISLMPFLYRYPCSIAPDFTSDRLYIEGEIMAEGKVRLAKFLLSFLRLFCDKEFKQVARRLMGWGE